MNDTLFIIGFLLYYGFAIWAIRDITKRNISATANLLAFIFLIFTPGFGILVYLYFRSSDTNRYPPRQLK